MHIVALRQGAKRRFSHRDKRSSVKVCECPIARCNNSSLPSSFIRNQCSALLAISFLKLTCRLTDHRAMPFVSVSQAVVKGVPSGQNAMAFYSRNELLTFKRSRPAKTGATRNDRYALQNRTAQNSLLMDSSCGGRPTTAQELFRSS